MRGKSGRWIKQFLLLLTAGVILSSKLSAQTVTRYIIKFTNKGGSSYSFSNPLAYLSQRAIDRRTRYNIPIDSFDLPVTASYLTQIRNVPNVSVLNVSKWLNSVTIQISDTNAVNTALSTINSFSFVQNAGGIALRMAPNNNSLIDKFQQENISQPLLAQRTDGITGDYYNYGATSLSEIGLHNGQFLHDVGLRGQGMQIAMLDNGFNNYTLPGYHAFDSFNTNGHVYDTWNYVFHQQNILNDGNHGMSCFSTIVANIPGQFVGMAPNANFELYQTEDNTSEYPIEEHNWACAAERADSCGADVITTSLGYLTFDPPLTNLNHTYADMNGHTTMAAIAGNIAAKKGILVFAAAGNEGTTSWHYIITPADGDSVIAVGAVNTSGVVASFSSYGPSSSGQVKPDVASVGSNAIIQTFGGGVGLSNGTSFACPKMAGLGTCLWQGFPEFNNMKIRTALWQAGSIASSPDTRMGYGIPNMKIAFTNLLIDFATSSSLQNGCAITVNWTSKDVGTMNYEIERKAPSDVNYSKVGQVSPLAGTILTNHSYQFIDNLSSGSIGTYSYRIRQIIDTAAATFTAAYVDTTNINVSSPCVVTGINNPNPNNNTLLVLPNPATGQATLLIETSYAITNMPIAIYDMSGKLMVQMLQSKGTGKAYFALPINKLAKGKYFIKVFNKQTSIGTAEFIRL